MTRVPVPDDYERGHVSVAGAKDYHYGEADVNLDDVDQARDVTVSEDEDGRYLGVSSVYAEEVAEFLGVPIDGAEGGADATEDDTGDGSDADDAPEDGGEGDETPTCGGNDGACSREVDEPGGLCWQHE